MIRFPVERRRAAIDAAKARPVLSFPSVVASPNMVVSATMTGWGTIAREIGSCPKCGSTVYENLVHSCPTNARIDDATGQMRLSFPLQPQIPPS